MLSLIFSSYKNNLNDKFKSKLEQSMKLAGFSNTYENSVIPSPRLPKTQILTSQLLTKPQFFKNKQSANRNNDIEHIGVSTDSKSPVIK